MSDQRVLSIIPAGAPAPHDNSRDIDSPAFALRMAAASPVPMLVLRAGDALLAWFNPAFATLIGAPACLHWLPLDDLLPGAVGLLPTFDAILSGSIDQAEPDLALPGGAGVMALALSPLSAPDGSVAGMLGIVRARPDHAGDSARELGRLLELSPMGVLRYRIDGAILDSNDAFLEMLGLERADLAAGLSWRALTPERWRAADERGLAQLFSRGEMALFEKAFYHRDGHAVPVLIGAGSLLPDHSSGFAVVVDLSTTKAAESALAASNARFRALADAMPQMVWSALPDGLHDYFNEQWYRFTGVPSGASDGNAWNGMFHPDDQAVAWERWRHSLATGKPYEIEYRLRHRDGSYRWVLGRALPVRDDSGAISRWMGTCTDIHEHKLTGDALREADQRKDEFLAMLGHELRNPLAPIRSAASLLPLIKDDPVRIEHLGRVIARQTTHMTGLIDDLLDVSRVTRGMVALERTDVSLRQLVDEAAEQARPLVETRSHLLTIDDRAPGALVHGDHKRLVQVFANLLSNAAKYTPTGGRIEVAIVVAGDEVQVAVRDNGVGMAPALLDSAFELFRQGARTPDRSQGGLGIGLPLVRSLVQLHDGQVRLSSPGEGLGCEALVTLPLCAGVSAALVAPHGEAPPQTGLRVLVVDDNADSAELVAMYLRMMGHVVATEIDAAAALARARDWRPEACILDIGLPDMDGNALALRLRALPGLSGVRLAAMTGYSQQQDRDSSAAAGIEAYFVKPVDMAGLAKWLASAWAG